MKIEDDDKSRILLKTNKNDSKKLCNLIMLRDKKTGQIYEIKLTFNANGFSFFKNVHFSSVKGILKKPSKINSYKGKVEVCYHSKGGISFKIIDKNEHKFYKTKSFSKINNPCHFFKISLKGLHLLPDFDRKLLRSFDKPLKIKKLLAKSLSVDFYLCKRSVRLNPIASIFKNNYQFLFYDEKEEIFLLLHFYEASNIDGFFLNIIDNFILKRMKRKIYYYLYCIKDWIFKNN